MRTLANPIHTEGLHSAAASVGHVVIGARRTDAPVQRLALPPDVGQSPRLQAQRAAMRAVMGTTLQRSSLNPADDAPVSSAANPQPVQRTASPPAPAAPASPPATPAATTNQTGMPDRLKAGIESLSGMDMSPVRVHRNSAKPAQLSASAYAQGNDIHLGPGQEQHLPHEAWHIVQQRQGRVRQTVQMAGVGVNDDAGLESEADVMGSRAASMRPTPLAVQRRVDTPCRAVQLDLISDLTQQTLGSFLRAKSLGALLSFADREALDALRSCSTFRNVCNTAVSFSNALGMAINIWDSIPAPIRTGILFLTGKLMASIPFVDALSYTEAFIVDADKDVRSTYLVFALDRLKLVLKAINSPVSSAVDFGKYLYSSWWSGSGGVPSGSGESQPVKPSDRQGELAKLNLKIIWLDIKALHLEESQSGKDGKRAQEGGLHADFAFGVNIFDKAWSLGQQQDLTLILPWSGGAILRSVGPVPIIDTFTFQDLFELRQLDMTMLEVSNEGLQQLAFSLGKMGIAKDTLTMSEATASYDNGSGMNFAGTMGLGIYGWNATARLGLALDSAGQFQQGTVENFSESSGSLKVDSVKLSKSEGFSIRNAELNLKRATDLDLTATLTALDIKQSQATGAGKIHATDIPLFGEMVKLTEAGGSVAYRSHTDWAIDAYAALAMDFEHVQASGRFSISHESATGITDLQLQNGQFKADYDGFGVTALGMAYEHSKKTLTLSHAQVDIKAIGTKADVDDVTINRDGLAFKQATISHPKPISPFNGLEIDSAHLKIEKNADELKLSASANLRVDISTPNVKGAAKDILLTFDNSGLRGEISALTVTTTPFSVDIENASLSKEKLSAEKAKVSFKTGGDQGSDHETGQMITDLKQGLLDFLPVGHIAFEAGQIAIDESGLRIGSFKPLIPPVSFKAFGIGASLDFERMRGELSGDQELSLARMAGGLTLKAEVFYPVFPGVEVYGSLAADAILKLHFGAHAGAQSDHWAVGGQVKVNAGVSLTAGLGAQLGSQLLVALSAGIFAKGEAKITDAMASVSGKTRYDRSARRFVVLEPLNVNYDFGAAAVLSIGGEFKAKAFYFYEYTIYQFTPKEWTLGQYTLQGKLGDSGGEVDPQKPSKLGLEGIKTAPAPTTALKKEDAEDKLRSDEPIANSGQARLALLKKKADETSSQLRDLHDAGRREREALKQIESRYIEVLRKKEQLFQAMAGTMSSDVINKKLAEFNATHDVEKLQLSYSALVTELEGIQGELDEALQKLTAVATTDAQSLEHGVKARLDEVHERSKLADKIIPDSGPLGDSVDTLAKAVDEEIQQQKVTLDTLNSVMSPKSFIGNTTTSGLFGETTRKTILPVDEALEGYHNAKSEQTLKLLQKSIETYLSSSSSQRVPYVLLLQSQVLAALKVLRLEQKETPPIR